MRRGSSDPADQPLARGSSRVGETFEVEVGEVAHGGHCVARHDGRVVFVRHAIPGERVRVAVTEGKDRDRFWRADAIEVLRPAAARVSPPCPLAGPGRCGGCDWQHVDIDAQRELKARVVMEQLRHLAGLEIPVVVEAVPGDQGGLGWRTRVTYAADAEGRLGLHRHRSHEIVPVERCLIAHPGVTEVRAEEKVWPDAQSVEVVAAGTGDRAVIVTAREGGGSLRLPKLAPGVSVLVAGGRGTDRVRGRKYVQESAAGRRWRISGGGFWQVHPGAADVLVDAVLAGTSPRPGDTVLDLYSGVGLFAGTLAERVGPEGSVVAIEADRRAVADARRNLHDLRAVELIEGRVETSLRRLGRSRADLVVLDPPRSGARRRVVEAVATLRPRAVAYLACDPAALARDVAIFGSLGYALRSIRAFDLFPMTHHVECVAVLEPDREPDRQMLGS